MRFLTLILFMIGLAFTITTANSQSVDISKDFSLGSPFSEPDGRSEIVSINNSDFVTLSKVKGSQSGKSDFALERYDKQLNQVWRNSFSVETFEDYKDLYFNGKELVLLSVVHQESAKTTKLIGYGFDPKDGKNLWTKELENFKVGDWETHPHKGSVKESFIDLVCEHVNQDFVTPFEYKHNISFSSDGSKFVSYVYNYGEANLTASVSVYDNACNLLQRGKVSIDNNYTNYGICINNAGKVFILNSNSVGKVNLIRFDLETKDFDLLDLPASNYQKDDFHVKFLSDDVVYVANSEVMDGKLFGVMYSKFNFSSMQVEFSTFEDFNGEFKSKILAERKNNKQMKGEEDWQDYDITHFVVDKEEEVFFVLEKRDLHGDGFPHIKRETFDRSHKVEFTGHIQAETIIMVAFNKDQDLKWKNFILKNQIYPANDGLNTISFVMHHGHPTELRLLYASSENFDGSLHAINLVAINLKDGAVSNTKNLPNNDKLTLVKDYSLFMEDNSLIIVGKKGLLGKTSMIVKYKL